MTPIRLLLVDDQPLVRSGLRLILGPDEDFVVVGECSDGDEVEAAVQLHRPDLVIMDVRMRRVDGAEATRRLRAQPASPPVLILTTFSDDEVLSSALRAGASGFLLKDAPGEEIVRAARIVAGGDAYLDTAVTARVLSAYQAVSAEDPEATTAAPAAHRARTRGAATHRQRRDECGDRRAARHRRGDGQNAYQSNLR